MQMAKAVGIAPKDVNYVPYDGGGELLASILGNKVAFGVSGVGEYLDQIKAGELRVLAVTSPKRVARTQGRAHAEASPESTWTSPTGAASSPRPASSDAERDKLVRLVDELHDSPRVEESMSKHGWADAFLTGDEFGNFLDEQDKRVASVLKELGL